MKRYNKDTIVKIYSVDIKHSRHISYHKGRKRRFFWQRNIKRGFYYNCVSLEYLGEECPSNHKLINGIVFELPEVNIKFIDGSKRTICFKKIEEADEYIKKITENGNWIP